MKYCFLLIFCCFTATASAQIFENLYDARSESMGRSISIGNANSALTGNPTSALSATKNLAAVGAQNRFLLTDIQWLNAGCLIKKDKQSFGIISQYSGNQYLKNWNIAGQYARQLHEKFSLGVRIRTGQINATSYGSQFYFDGDVGLNTTINPKLSLGVLIQNLARFERNEQQQAGTTLRFGIGYTLSKKVKMLLETAHIFNQKISLHSGVEYLATQSLSFRVGTRSNPVMPSLGVGYHLNQRLSIDFFAAHHSRLGMSSGLNLGVQF